MVFRHASMPQIGKGHQHACMPSQRSMSTRSIGRTLRIGIVVSVMSNSLACSSFVGFVQDVVVGRDDGNRTRSFCEQASVNPETCEHVIDKVAALLPQGSQGVVTGSGVESRWPFWRVMAFTKCSHCAVAHSPSAEFGTQMRWAESALDSL